MTTGDSDATPKPRFAAPWLIDVGGWLVLSLTLAGLFFFVTQPPRQLSAQDYSAILLAKAVEQCRLRLDVWRLDQSLQTPVCECAASRSRGIEVSNPAVATCINRIGSITDAD